MSAPRISVVIPTRNGAATLPALLDALWAQRTLGPVEIVAVDSGSTDGSLDLLKARVHQLHTIDPDAFNHGATRNLGVDKASGDVVVLIVQDALPRSETWLTSLVEPLVADPTVAGSFARQVPRLDAGRLTRAMAAGWVGASTEGRIARVASQEAFDELTPAARLDVCTFDNVASCIRRAVWQQYPFPDVPIAEDLGWARSVLLAGHGLAYVPDAVVEHSHERSALYEYRRTRLLHARLYDLFYLQLVPTVPVLATGVGLSLLKHLRHEWRTWSGLTRATALAVAWPLGQYHGAHDAIMERSYRPPANAV